MNTHHLSSSSSRTARPDVAGGAGLRELLAAHLERLRQRTNMRRLLEMDDHLHTDIGFQRTDGRLLGGWPMWQMLPAAR